MPPQGEAVPVEAALLVARLSDTELVSVQAAGQSAGGTTRIAGLIPSGFPSGSVWVWRGPQPWAMPVKSIKVVVAPVAGLFRPAVKKAELFKKAAQNTSFNFSAPPRPKRREA